MWSTTDRIFCHFGSFFALSPTNNPKNQNFETRYHHFTLVYHKWHHMMYASWYMMYASTWCFEHSDDISCSLLVNLSHTDECWEGRNTYPWIYIYIYICICISINVYTSANVCIYLHICINTIRIFWCNWKGTDCVFLSCNILPLSQTVFNIFFCFLRWTHDRLNLGPGLMDTETGCFEIRPEQDFVFYKYELWKSYE